LSEGEGEGERGSGRWRGEGERCISLEHLVLEH